MPVQLVRFAPMVSVNCLAREVVATVVETVLIPKTIAPTVVPVERFASRALCVKKVHVL